MKNLLALLAFPLILLGEALGLFKEADEVIKEMYEDDPGTWKVEA